ncbi:MAG: glycoside hydrolase family 13 protein [Clostridia bacterium]|nr:glycoside hydrolase family 13 protein [Clostridia bacterium]
MTHLWHDPYNEIDRFPQGAMPAGSVVRLRLKVKGDCEKACVRIWGNEGEHFIPMRHVSGITYEANVPVGTKGLLWYYFVCDTSEGKVYCGKPIGEVCADYVGEPPSFQITVYDPAFMTPVWMRNSVCMQIMVDRYFIGGGKVNAPHGRGAYLHSSWNESPNIRVVKKGEDGEGIDFFGGNLKGVTEKLDYIRSLGINALYFNPIFRARSNHKYDTGDYMEIDPSFGTMEDFENLVSACKKADMHVILDGVFSHTGADSRYFNKFGTYDSLGAFQSGKSPYASWYRFGKTREEYDCWWDFDTLPNVNEMEPGYLDFIVRSENSVIGSYLKKGASGWRLDVADELPMDFIRELRRRAKAEGMDNCVIGEVWEDPTNKVAYGKHRNYAVGDTLDSTMNYPLRENIINFLTGKIDAYTFSESLNHQLSTLPKPMLYSMMNLLGSHDRPRIINMLAEDKNNDLPYEKRKFVPLSKKQYALGKERYLKAWEFVCNLPGMPTVYYGDEVGLTGIADPICRMPYPWGNEDLDLRSRISSINQNRLMSNVLKRGETRITAVNSDTVRIDRYIKDGIDAFGAKAESGESSYTLKR